MLYKEIALIRQDTGDTHMKDKAYDYLNRDRLHHIDMLETMDRNNAKVIYEESDGVLLLNITGCTYMISAESEETIEKMCGLISEPELMTVHQAQLVPMLEAKYGYKNKMECFQCAYLSHERLDESISAGIELRGLTLEELPFVYKNYDHPSEESYIAERIEAGMIGAFCGNECAGFIGTHAEGTMGILQVMDDYRRRGIAYSLEVALINRMLEQGYIPHAHIVTTNKASILLQKKIGMSFSDKTLTWLYND